MQLAALLDSYLIESPPQSFDWGTANCCHFVNKWVTLATGHDHMAAMKLRITETKMDARRLIVELGGSLEAAWTKGLGIDPISPKFAQVGDVMLVPLPDGGELVGICVGRLIVCAEESGALVHVEAKLASHAWRTTDAKC